MAFRISRNPELDNSDLSEENSALLAKYHELMESTSLSTKDSEFIEQVWNKAADDDSLYESLMEINETNFSEGEENHLSISKERRLYLSEYLPVIAQQQLQEFQGEFKENLDESAPHVSALCPDNQGFVRVPMPKEGFSEHEFSSTICSRCHRPFSEHKNYFYTTGIRIGMQPKG